MKVKKGIFGIIMCAAMAVALCLGFSACNNVDKAKEYTLTFITNGAAEIAPITAVAGAEITPPADPVKDDCAFEGWYEQEDFSGDKVTVPDKMPERNVTYYAHFTALQKAVLKLDFGGVKENAEYQLLTGTNVSQFLKDIDTSSDKADFVGWYVGDSPLKDTQSLSASGLTVKAVWEVGYTFNVYKEGTEGYVFDKSYSLKGTLGEAPELDENYGGEGYVLSKDTTVPKLTLGENKIDLYYDLATFTITYIIDDSDYENGIVQKEYRYNETVTIDNCTLQREGYRFIGWATGYGKAPDDRYKPEQKVVVTSTIDLFACWNRAYTEENGGDVVWLNPLVTDSGAATLERGEKVYEGEVNGADLVFVVEGKEVHARITDTENFLFTYRDGYYGFYEYYDYTDNNTYKSDILFIDGYGAATYNTVDINGGTQAEYYGKYSFTEYNDFEFVVYDVETGQPAIGVDGNRLFFYFTIAEYSDNGDNITGSFTIQGLESGAFLEYGNGEMGYDTLVLNGYGLASLYTYDAEEEKNVLIAEGRYTGTENYESAYGEWLFASNDGQISFEFILSFVNNGGSATDIYIVFDESIFGEFSSTENKSSLYLDGYGSALYTTADETVLEGIAVVEGDFVTFYAYGQDGQSVGTIYFNLDRTNKTFSQNDEGFVINGTVITKYVGKSAIIEIPDEITEIGDNAFHYIDLDCTVISVTIPASVTKIGARAFENNSTLRRVYVKGATPCTLGDKAFDWVGGDFMIIVPDGSVELYRTAAGWSNYKDYIFGEQEVLNKPEFEIENGVLVRYNRKDVSGSVNLVIPDEVTEIAAGVFRGVTYLASVDFNNVKKIGANAFALCTNLNSIICTNVEEIGESAFLECLSLKKINLPAVKVIGATAFSACYGLTRVTVGESIQSIGDMAFRECAVSYSIGSDGLMVAVPELLYIELTGDTVPDMGGTVFFGTQGRVQVKNIDVAMTCISNPTWGTYAGTLYIPSGEEKGVYYNIENLQTLVLDGRAILYSMEVWLYAIEGNDIHFIVFNTDGSYSIISGTIKNGVITLQSDSTKICFIKEGEKVTYTDKDGNELEVTLGGGNENTISYIAAATYNEKQIELYVEGNSIYFNLDGYKYDLTLFIDYTFSANVNVIPYTVHVTAKDGSALDITFGKTLGVTGTFKDIDGEERTAQTIGSWYITEQSKDVYTVTVFWKANRYLVTVTVSGDTFEYEWKLNVSVTSYPDEATGNGVIVYTNAQGEIVDVHLMIKGADGIKHDVSKNYELKEDGTYIFVVNETVERYDEETKEVVVEPSPFNGTYTVTLNMQNRTCEIVYKNSI